MAEEFGLSGLGGVVEIPKPSRSKPSVEKIPKKVGVRPVKDVVLSTRVGLVKFRAHLPVKDASLVALLERSGAKLEPVYE